MNKDFSIDHIDPLGQGVSKIGDKITFVSKTLPGEVGTAQVIKTSKGVIFATLDNPNNLSKTSSDRLPSPCPHFNECSGCQYLHTSYEREIKFKQETLERGLQKVNLNIPKIHVHPAPKRFHYRNRMQLHYDLSKDQIGLISTTGKIMSVPECLLPIYEVKAVMNDFYRTGDWKNYIGKKKKGHLEIYLDPKSKSPKIKANKSYAFGGFSQVFEQMNGKAQEIIKNFVANKKDLNVLDLFGGSGNLTQQISNDTLVVDSFIDEDKLSPHQKALKLNIYDKNAPKLLKDRLTHFTKGSSILILDPPRSGLKNLKDFLFFSPPQIAYMSCNSATQLRDLKNIEGYQIQSVHLLDFFPGTKHFETIVLLGRT